MPRKPASFRPHHQPTRQEQNREYDSRRGSFRERGYSTHWDVAALAFRRVHPLCLGCEAIGRVKPSALVDHVIPHKGDQGLMWDQANWQACCQWHHDVVKQRLEQYYETKRIRAEDLRLDSEPAKRLTRHLNA